MIITEVLKNNINEQNQPNFISDFIDKDNFLPFDENNPYDTVDGLIFSNFSYIPIGKIDIPYYDGKDFDVKILNKKLGNIAKDVAYNDKLMSARFFTTKRIGSNMESEYNCFKNFFLSLSKNPRYKDLKIVDYKVILNRYKKGDVCQFCAFLIEIEEGKEYVVANRGTDSTSEGWYEDVMMIYKNTNAQKACKEFVEKCIETYPDAKFHLAGHSKGGNGIIYSMIAMNYEKNKNVDLIAFDSPLFNKDFTEKNKAIMERLVKENKLKFVNVENSVFGEALYGIKYLHTKDNVTYVKSTNKVFMLEHNIYSMNFTDDNLHIGNISKTSRYINNALIRIEENHHDDLILALFCLFNIIGKDTVYSTFNKYLSRKEKADIVINNFINEPNENILITYKIFKMIFADTRGAFEDIEENIQFKQKFTKAINEKILEKIQFETIEDIIEFKESLENIKKILFEKNHDSLKDIIDGFISLRMKYKKNSKV